MIEMNHNCTITIVDRNHVVDHEHIKFISVPYVSSEEIGGLVKEWIIKGERERIYRKKLEEGEKGISLASINFPYDYEKDFVILKVFVDFVNHVYLVFYVERKYVEDLK